MTDRFRDFDSFDAELRDEPITFRLAGREWTAVNAGDAATFLRFVRRADRGAGDSLVAVAEYLEDMLAVEERTEFAQALRTHSIKTRTISEIVTWVFLRASGLPLAKDGDSPEQSSANGVESRVVSLSAPSKSKRSVSVAS